MLVPWVAALVVAAVACISDVRTRRIPNILTFGAAAGALVYSAATAGAGGLGSALAGWGLGTVLFLPFFLLRGMGAGDVKLLAAIGAWIGPAAVLWVAICSSLAGGLLAVILAVSRGYLRTACTNIIALGRYWAVAGLRPLPGLTLESSESPRLPYAIPICIGTMVTLWLR